MPEQELLRCPGSDTLDRTIPFILAWQPQSPGRLLKVETTLREVA